MAMVWQAPRVSVSSRVARLRGFISVCGMWMEAFCLAIHCALSRWWLVVEATSGTSTLATPACAACCPPPGKSRAALSPAT
eukprot:gene30965-38268_t